jgi:coenzyme F420-0:L-glutamate ligase / coenzyme F420-1:gamma-L-glutamate ligase
MAPAGLGKIEVIPLSGVPEVREGEDLGKILLASVKQHGIRLVDRDIFVVKQKVVSKAEGQLVRLDAVHPGSKAKALAKSEGKDPRLVELILREATRIVRTGHGVIITETRHGFVCANSGVDQSNVGKGLVALLPRDPDRSAKKLRRELERGSGRRLAVVISDTFGRPWRVGQTDVAIGCSGILPLLPYAGKKDRFGYELRVTEPSVADEVAGAAELATGKLTGIPAAIVRGAEYVRGDKGVRSVIMPPERDLFR